MIKEAKEVLLLTKYQQTASSRNLMNKDKKVLAFVPARCGSQSIKLKNIKLFCGQPLIYWNLLALQEAPSITQIVLATDCDEIQNTARGFGFSKLTVYRRQAANATDTSSTESVMLEYLQKEPQSDETLFMLVQATSPLTITTHFEQALTYMEKQAADSLLTCVRTKRFFWTANGHPVNYDHTHRPRRQDFDGMLMENGAFYITSVASLKAHQNRLSGKVAVYEMPEYTAVEIDEEDDWPVAEAMMKKHVLPRLKGRRHDFSHIKALITDVDGVLTDASMYYTEHGDELKKFNTHDGKGLELLRQAGLKVAIITTENTQIVARRAAKLKVDYVYQGIKDKLPVALDICQKEGFTLNEIAYIGDDVNDLTLLEKVGLAVCPANATPKVKALPGIVQLPVAGGNGAVRYLAEMILANR